jgi:hypothetical protein
MSQVLTPEEMAALFEGLMETEDGSRSLYYHAPQEATPRARVSPKPCRGKRSRNLSAWLMVLADLRWPNL